MNGPTTLLDTALATGDVTNPPGNSPLHGEHHWKCVALMGFSLMRAMPATRWDLELLFSFAVTHDLMRENDDEDPGHGLRAAHLVTQLCIHPGLDGFSPYDHRTADLLYAVSGHVNVMRALAVDNPTVGLCWDADRLTLWRVGKTPEDEYLSTPAAKRQTLKRRGLQLCMTERLPSWGEIQQELDRWRYP